MKSTTRYKQHCQLIMLLPSMMLFGCATTPTYQTPSLALPAQFKQARSSEAAPQAEADWWRIYADTQLNQLIEQATKANQNIQQAEARYAQAVALSDAANGASSPTLAANGAASRNRRASNNGGESSTQNSASIGLSASWEADLWGRIRYQALASQQAAEASAADRAAAILLVQASVAQSYFQLRVQDTQLQLLDDTVQAYERSLQLSKNRYTAGIASRVDVAQAETQLAATRAQRLDAQLVRQQYENALAILLGSAPAQFRLAAQPLPRTAKDSAQLALPNIPQGLPSQLLQRRPDIRAAERRVAAANAAIGVASAALYPSLTLSASGGYQANRFADLINTPNQVWALGSSLAASLWDGGQRQAQTRAASANFDAAAANYRQTVLSAFQEIEDNLAALSLLAREAEAQHEAVRYAQESLQQALNRYQAGTADYLGVVVAQTTALTNERAALNVLARRLTASVGLVRGLGGGWRG